MGQTATQLSGSRKLWCFGLLLLLASTACDRIPPRGTVEYERYLRVRADAIAARSGDADVNLFLGLQIKSFDDAEPYFRRVAGKQADALTTLYVGAFYGGFLEKSGHEVSTRDIEIAESFLQKTAVADPRNAVPRAMLAMLAQQKPSSVVALVRASAIRDSEVNFYAKELTASMVRALQKIDRFDSYDVLFVAVAGNLITAWSDRFLMIIGNGVQCDAVDNFSWITRYVDANRSRAVFRKETLEIDLWQAVAQFRLREAMFACGMATEQDVRVSVDGVKERQARYKTYVDRLKQGLSRTPALGDSENEEWEIAKTVANGGKDRDIARLNRSRRDLLAILLPYVGTHQADNAGASRH